MSDADEDTIPLAVMIEHHVRVAARMLAELPAWTESHLCKLFHDVPPVSLATVIGTSAARNFDAIEEARRLLQEALSGVRSPDLQPLRDIARDTGVFTGVDEKLLEQLLPIGPSATLDDAARALVLVEFVAACVEANRMICAFEEEEEDS